MADQRFTDVMQALKELGDEVAVPMKGGKFYTMVKDRIEIFRREFGAEFGIDTNVDFREGFGQGAAVVANAKITATDNTIVASGWAVEFVGSTKLTTASPVEVAETSAIGRALACFGLHGGEYASLDEMSAHQRKDEFRGDKNYAPSQVVRPIHQKPEPEFRQDNGPATGNGGIYVPSDHDAMWLQPEAEVDKILEQIEEIETQHELGDYWAKLKPFMKVVNKDHPDLIAEIKAAFVERQNAFN